MKRALVVEDEVVVGIYLSEELSDVGFHVAVRHDAESALEWLSVSALDVAIIDVGLPHMRGDELAMHIRRVHPDVPLILATGLDRALLSKEVREDRATCVLEKPFDRSSLMACLVDLGVNGSGEFAVRQDIRDRSPATSRRSTD